MADRQRQSVEGGATSFPPRSEAQSPSPRGPVALIPGAPSQSSLLGQSVNPGASCAGLRVRSNTLRAMEAQPQGCIYDWDGDLTVEVLPQCTLSESLQNLIAMGLADQEVQAWLTVSEWARMRVGNLIVLKPKTRDEAGNLLPLNQMPWETVL